MKAMVTGCSIVILLALGAASVARAAGPLRWQETADESLALVAGDQVVWRFNFAPRLEKPYFHPLAPVDGPVLTWDSPPDHVWHHGLWFSWKFINGINYWESVPDNDRPLGRTEASKVRIERRDDFSARIALRVAYIDPAGETMLREDRVLEVSPPNGERGYSIDWTSDFTAVAEHVKLDRTPIPGEPNGVGYGGYAGLSVRLAPLADRETITPDGPIGFENGSTARLPAAPAVDYSGKVDGRGAGIAMLADPAGFRAPPPWYIVRSREMNYFSPAILCFRPHEMRRGESLTLRYRVCVHADAWTAEQLAAEQTRWLATRHDRPVEK